jgi:TRAP-type C4-dicarboxylate transport system permease small subunit
MRTLVAFVRVLRIAAMAALALAVLITIADAALRDTLNVLVPGGAELLQLGLVTSVFLALPDTYLRDDHVTSELVDHYARPRTVLWLKRAAALLTAIFLALVAWRMAIAAMETLELGDRTSDLQIRLAWYWLPLLVGAAAAVVASAFAAARALRSPDGSV